MTARYGGAVVSSPNVSSLSTTSINDSNNVNIDTMEFDFERMTINFEQIQDHFKIDPSSLPPTDQFLEAMTEITRLFETLGTAFTFVKSDIDLKMNVIKEYQLEDPQNYNHLTKAVEYELNTKDLMKPLETGERRSCTRTLYRLMWALKFADYLLDGLSKTFDPNSGLAKSERTLKWAVTRAYNEALAMHHSWAIRRTVRTACHLLPTKEAFMTRIGIKSSDRETFLHRLVESLTPLTKRMYAFYEKHGLLDIP